MPNKAVSKTPITDAIRRYLAKPLDSDPTLTNGDGIARMLVKLAREGNLEAMQIVLERCGPEIARRVIEIVRRIRDDSVL